MNTRTVISLIVVILIILGGWYYWQQSQGSMVQTPGQTSSSGAQAQTTSDNVITFATPADFGLAVTPEQVLAHAYIPPCEEGFNYCLYYNGQEYKGTNFESAGMSITKRTDLKTENTCLNSPPNGFSVTTEPENTTSTTNYSMSVFPVGDAAAGHTSSGSDYRLYARGTSTCYEFQTRVGEAQFANFPAGSIKEFTDADKASVDAKLKSILSGMTLLGEKITLP